MQPEQNPYESPSHSSYLDRDEQSILDRANIKFFRVNQMIFVALIGGLLAYAVFSYSQNSAKVIPRFPSFVTAATIILASLVILLIGFGLEFTDIGLSLVMRRVNAYSDVNARAIAATVGLSTRHTISLAIRVAAAFYCIFVYTQSRIPLLLLPAAVLIFSMIVCFPTLSRFKGRLRRILSQTPHSI